MTPLLAALRAAVGAEQVLTEGDLSAYELDWRKRFRGRVALFEDRELGLSCRIATRKHTRVRGGRGLLVHGSCRHARAQLGGLVTPPRPLVGTDGGRAGLCVAGVREEQGARHQPCYEGQSGEAAYSASKGGVVSMILPAARELGPLGIRVVGIAPGLFGTQTLFDMEKNLDSRLARQIPFPHRFGDPAEFAMLVLHVIKNVMINGSVLRLDGGYHR